MRGIRSVINVTSGTDMQYVSKMVTFLMEQTKTFGGKSIPGVIGYRIYPKEQRTSV